MTRPSISYPRIGLVGDSFTAGLYATEGNEFRALLLPTLQAENSAHGAEQWYKGGVSGGKMQDAAANLSGFFQLSLQPQIVVLLLGQNDVGGGRTEEEFRADTETCMDYVINNSKAALLVVAIPFQIGWKSSASASGNKARAFNVILSEEAAARNCRYLDRWADCMTTNGISGSGDVSASEATDEDGYHPNNTGHQELHDALWADLQPLIVSALRRGAIGRSSASRSEASGRAAA